MADEGSIYDIEASNWISLLEASGIKDYPAVLLESNDTNKESWIPTRHAANIRINENFFYFEGRNGWLEFDVVVTPGSYWLCMEIIAEEPRWLNVMIKASSKINVEAQNCPAAGGTTGSWGGVPKWFVYGPYSFNTKSSVLRLETDSYFPHLRRIALAPSSLTPRSETRERPTRGGRFNKFHNLPEYWQIVESEQSIAPVPENKVPPGLLSYTFPSKVPAKGIPYRLQREEHRKIDITTPGPYKAHLVDGSVVEYYWFPFCNQPLFEDLKLTPEEKHWLQELVISLHKQQASKPCMAPPASGRPLVALDKGLVLTPPKGMEFGFVPIATSQYLQNSLEH